MSNDDYPHPVEAKKAPSAVLVQDAERDGHHLRVSIERIDDQGRWRPACYPYYLKPGQTVHVDGGLDPAQPLYVVIGLRSRRSVNRYGLFWRRQVVLSRFEEVDSVHITSESALLRVHVLENHPKTPGEEVKWEIQPRHITDSTAVPKED
ncbi:MAG: hypothetical protein ACREB9_05685 [Thermoplasmata archaeon]